MNYRNALMARIVVRIELHGAKVCDYEEVHKKMVLKGYTRRMHDYSSSWFKCPTAEYLITRNATPALIRDEVSTVVGSINKSYSVMATDASYISSFFSEI
jgi:hypothetical protein